MNEFNKNNAKAGSGQPQEETQDERIRKLRKAQSTLKKTRLICGIIMLLCGLILLFLRTALGVTSIVFGILIISFSMQSKTKNQENKIKE